MKRFLSAALAALLLLALPACGAQNVTEQPPVTEEEQPAPPPEPTEEELAAQEIDDLLSSLTTEEKVGPAVLRPLSRRTAPWRTWLPTIWAATSSSAGTLRTRPPMMIQTVRAYQTAVAADTASPAHRRG
ncbi:MAG: hypothetical protein V8R40_12680 [Dysosmobacter sp.]